jgi:long-chain fatty acid transport protein
MRWRFVVACTCVCVALAVGRAGVGKAQSFGVELHNTLMPASGGMGGASLALPQDLVSAVNGNPATLADFAGTQFSFGGAWVEPTFNLRHAGGVLPNVGTFAARSHMQGSAAGNIGVTQDLRPLGLPGTLGMGFITGAGGGVDFREVPASNGTSSALTVFEITNALGIDLTDRLALGASLTLGTGFFDGPFVGISAMTLDYALRGAVGLNYRVAEDTRVGFYYQTPQNFQFDEAIVLELGGGGFDIARDIAMELPDNLGLGIANESLCDGRLLLAVDVLFKQWENAALYDAIYDNQWVVQAGAQYRLGRVKLRAGYVWAEDPIKAVAISAGGITPPGAQAAIEYLQAQMAIVNEHRFTAGVGVEDCLLPGLDLDVFAGFMPYDSQQFGEFTSASLESYWLGAAFTWRFGNCGRRGGCAACAGGP